MLLGENRLNFFFDIMVARLNAGSWLVLGLSLLLLIGCEQFTSGAGQKVWKATSDSAEGSSLIPETELAATPTLRSGPETSLNATGTPAPLAEGSGRSEELGTVVESQSVLLKNDAGELDNLKGIGRFVGLTTCSASLIDLDRGLGAPAYILAAGRCVQPRLANEVYLNGPVGDMHVIFNFFANSKGEQINIAAKNIAYSTMKGRDLAIVELDGTLGDLIEKGVAPLPIRDVVVNVDEPLAVTMIGAPAVGFPPEESYLRMEKCVLSGPVDLVEGQLFTYSGYRTDCKDNFSGSAGSPILIGEDFEIIGINSTSTVTGIHPCSLGAPCEIAEQTTLMRENTSYATPLSGLASCFSQEGWFDLSLENCPLDDGRQLRLANTLSPVVQSFHNTADGESEALRWNTVVAGDFTYYRYKSGLIGKTDCMIEEGYSDVFQLEEGAAIDEQIPEEEGIDILCVIGGDSESITEKEKWQKPKFSTAVIVRVDNTPPELDPIVVFVHDKESISIQFHSNPPELSYYEYKVGSLNETECQDLTDYNLSPPEPLQILKDQLQYKLCVIAVDAAGNKALPYEILLGGEELASPVKEG